MDKQSKTVVKRVAEDKERILEHLRSTPIIQLAVKQANISRASYYRWCKEDKKFAHAAQEAIQEGYSFVNDIAESQLLSLIKEKKFDALRFWLIHNKSRYGNKLELSGTVITKDEALTPEQEDVVKAALKLASLQGDNEKEKTNETR